MNVNMNNKHRNQMFENVYGVCGFGCRARNLPDLRLLLLLVILLLCIFTISGCKQVKFGEQELKANQFVKRSLLRSDGAIRTYPSGKEASYQEYGVKPDDILAESMGLGLLYFVGIKDKKLFDKSWGFVSKYMISKYNLVAWKYDMQKNEPATSSSTVDDFRLVRALLLAHATFKDDKYLAAGVKLGNAILEHEIVNGYPIEFFAWGGNGVSASAVVDLSFLDLYAMKMLAKFDNRWQQIFISSRDLILRSLSEHGLFYDKYNPQKNEFYNKDNNLINKLMCAIHLAQVGVHETSVIRFIDKRMHGDGVLFGRYDAQSGNATVDYDAVSVYALALHFAVLYEQETLVDTLSKKLSAYQVSGSDLALQGCFGVGNCHAFDTLQTLLVLRLQAWLGD